MQPISTAHAFQRALEAGARLLVAASRSRAGWLMGTAALAFAKAVENMEISDNVGHGQGDWMNNPKTHSTTWEWDMVGPSSQWRYSHNYRHHVFTNVLEMDDDLGFGVMRLSRDQPWRPRCLVQSLRNLLLATTSEWGLALHGIHAAQNRRDGGREGPLLAFASANLCCQVEHRPFRGLPSNRYAEIATRVRARCDKFDCHHRLAAGPVPAISADHP